MKKKDSKKSQIHPSYSSTSTPIPSSLLHSQSHPHSVRTTHTQTQDHFLMLPFFLSSELMSSSSKVHHIPSSASHTHNPGYHQPPPHLPYNGGQQHQQQENINSSSGHSSNSSGPFAGSSNHLHPTQHCSPVLSSTSATKILRQCPVCNKQLPTPELMKRHLESHHESNGRTHFCHVCHKGFKQAAHVKTHLSTVHDESEIFICPICNKRCRHGRNFKRHMLIHEGLKPYPCELCGRQFRQATHLKAHLSSHEGLKPFSCDTCGKCFSRSDNLKRHKLIHNPHKPFTCDCGKTYTQSHHLRTHALKCMKL